MIEPSWIGLALFVFLVSPITAVSQSAYSLSDCIKIALKENPQIKQAQSNAAIAAEAKKGSTYSFIPSLSLSNQHNLSTGRVLDPTTYQFITNRTVFDMSASVGGSVTLFDGGERTQQVRKAKLNLQSALLETERTRNDLTLNVTSMFLNLVLDREAIAVIKNKLALFQDQEERIRKKIEYSAAAPSDLLTIQADVTNAQVDLTNACSNFDLDRIALCELLAINDWQNFDITIEGQDLDDIQPRLWDADNLVQSAFTLPQIRQKELTIESASRDICIASSAFWPTLRLNAGYGTTFSNARIRLDGNEYSFRDQLRDNMSSYVTLSVSIPILSAISVSNTVKQRKLAQERAKQELTMTKLALDKEVKQAVVNTNASYAKYQLLEDNVTKCREALRLVGLKYDAGATTYYDYQIAVSNLFQAEEQRLQAKYEYIFRTYILKFYGNQGWL